MEVGRGEEVVAIVAGLGLLALSSIAWANDLRAFEAVATPGLYCWMLLCIVCAVGMVVTARARRAGMHVPWYFRAALYAGIAGGLLTVPSAFRVITKQEATAPPPLAAAHIDLRNQMVQDRSFAERNLRRSELSGATFHHVDLSGADLSESDLRRARFEDVDLSRATLCGVDLRGADLRGARGLGDVADWSYAFYDRHTLMPKSSGLLLRTREGPIPDTGRDLLYMCTQDVTRRIHG
jgi:hypothetical protein